MPCNAHRATLFIDASNHRHASSELPQGIAEIPRINRICHAAKYIFRSSYVAEISRIFYELRKKYC